MRADERAFPHIPVFRKSGFLILLVLLALSSGNIGNNPYFRGEQKETVEQVFLPDGFMQEHLGDYSSKVEIVKNTDRIDLVKNQILQSLELADKDRNRIHDDLDFQIHKYQFQDKNRKALNVIPTNNLEMIRVGVILNSSNYASDVSFFKTLGGRVVRTWNVIPGFEGIIPISNISKFASSSSNLEIIEPALKSVKYSDSALFLTRVRNSVWTKGYFGDPNSSIAIIDTGIDDSHPILGPFEDLNWSANIVGWYDATSDGAITPEDFQGHGSHVSGIAAGLPFDSNSSDGRLASTWSTSYTNTGTSTLSNVAFRYPLNVSAPGQIDIRYRFDSTNLANTYGTSLRIYAPDGTLLGENLTVANQEYSLSVSTSYTGFHTIALGITIAPSETIYVSSATQAPYGFLGDGIERFSGVAPDTKLVGIKVFNRTGSGTSLELINGLDWLYTNAEKYHVVVASMSLGFQGTVVSVDSATARLVEKGIVVLVAAGNSGQGANNIMSPGQVDGVITVAATDDFHKITRYSSSGPGSGNTTKPDIAAPGGEFSQGAYLQADTNDGDADGQIPELQVNDVTPLQGTSMATPHAAGIAALLAQILGGYASWTYGTKTNNYKIKQVMLMSTFEVYGRDYGLKDIIEGYGEIQADAAVDLLTSSLVINSTESVYLSDSRTGQKLLGRNVYLTQGNTYLFKLENLPEMDADLFLYDGSPDLFGEPILLDRSTIPVKGANETISFTPTKTGTYYIIAKLVTGSGLIRLDVTEFGKAPVVSIISPSFNERFTNTISIQVSAIPPSGGSIEQISVVFDDDPKSIDLSNKFNSSTGYYETYLNASTFMPGIHGLTVKVMSQYGEAEKSVVFGITVGMPPILLVDDDGGGNYEDYYRLSLAELGFQPDIWFDYWNIEKQGSPSATNLTAYELVIWFTGTTYSNTLTLTDQSNLQTFLDGGGSLFVSGQDIGYDINSSQFYADYLHASYIADLAGDTSQARSYLNDIVFKGKVYDLNSGDGAKNSRYPDVVSAINGGNASLYYGSNQTEVALISYSGTYRILYAAFNFEAISTSAQRTDFMNDTLSFLIDRPPILNITSSLKQKQWETILSSTYYIGWDAVDDHRMNYYDIYLDYELIASTSQTWIEIFDIPEGKHVITVVGYDSVGQRSVDKAYIFVDYSSPIISITTPLQGDIITNQTVRVEWIGTDPNPDATVGNFIVYVNGSELASGLITNFAVITLPYQEAYYNITIGGTDSFGNYAWDSIIVYLNLSQETTSTTTTTTSTTSATSTETTLPTNTVTNSSTSTPIQTAPTSSKTTETLEPSSPEARNGGASQFLDASLSAVIFSILAAVIFRISVRKER